MFTSLLIQKCSIQRKGLTTSGYEKIEAWTDIATNVACRRSTSNGVSISDNQIRTNTDDDKFFFDPDVTIARDNRIVLDGLYFSVIKVNKIYDSSKTHHIEVIARATDHK